MRPVSTDGTRVFWTAGHGLYMRDTATEETIRLDVPEPGVTGGGEEGDGVAVHGGLPWRESVTPSPQCIRSASPGTQ